MNARRPTAQIAGSAILRRVRLHGPQTTADLTESLPWSMSTIRKATAILLADGLLLRMPPPRRKGSAGIHPYRFDVGPLSGLKPWGGQ